MVARVEVKTNVVVEALALGHRSDQILVAPGLLASVVGLTQPTSVVDARRLVNVRVVNDNLGVDVRRVDPLAAEVLREIAFGLYDPGHDGCDDHLFGTICW